MNAVTDLIPISPVLGTQSFLTLGWVFSPLAGLMLGPVSGGISCLLATLIELFLGRPVLSLGPAGLFRSPLAAFETGLLTSGRWSPASAILVILILGWLTLPTGREAAAILVFHLFGLVLIFILRSRMESGLSSQSRRYVGMAVWASSYCGNMARHLYGNLLFVLVAGLPSQIFLAAMPLTLLEQAFFSFASFILGTSLIRLRLRQTTYLG
jgi:biotin transporter BioY